ncbi:phage tail assembly protein [Pseudomonas veronii]
MKTETTEQPDVKPLADDNTVILDTPIRRGTTSIDSITLRKPNSGELRGVSLSGTNSRTTTAAARWRPRASKPPAMRPTSPHFAARSPSARTPLS